MAIAIIGAGLAGLTAARILQDAGLAPMVFDKSRGLGGRLATRRRGHWTFDHGAPGVDPAGSDLPDYLARAEAAGAAVATGRAPNTHRGTPGMSALVKPLAEGIEVCREAEVARVIARDGNFALLDAADEAMGTFSHVICATPSVQAARLLAAVLNGAAVQRLEAVRMDPCWTLMAGWEGFDASVPRAAPPFQSILRQAHADPVWVAHATPAWSAAHLETTKEDACDLLLNALMAQLGTARAPDIAMAHRWRFARTAQALGRPYLEQAGGRLLAGGDWALGPEAGHAHASGQAMGRAMATTLMASGEKIG